jgi:hypothetical protein
MSDYNGYTNRETWGIALMIDSQGDSEYVEELVKQALENNTDGHIIYDVSKTLREWIEENNPLTGQCTLYADLLNCALCTVDWNDLARKYIQSYRENLDYAKTNNQ